MKQFTVEQKELLQHRGRVNETLQWLKQQTAETNIAALIFLYEAAEESQKNEDWDHFRIIAQADEVRSIWKKQHPQNHRQAEDLLKLSLFFAPNSR